MCSPYQIESKEQLGERMIKELDEINTHIFEEGFIEGLIAYGTYAESQTAIEAITKTLQIIANRR